MKQTVRTFALPTMGSDQITLQIPYPLDEEDYDTLLLWLQMIKRNLVANKPVEDYSI